jgi:DNA-binding NtrC family response regulator
MSHNSCSIRVLVVDDEVIIADTLTTILRQRGYDAHTAYSAERALEWCRDKLPKAVITDVIMGPMNGVQLAIHLANTLPDCKVLILSGHVLAASSIADSIARGYEFPILAKPVHPQEILDFLESVHPLDPPMSR